MQAQENETLAPGAALPLHPQPAFWGPRVSWRRLRFNHRLGVAMTISASSAVLPRDDTQLVFMGGLPGSGKTHYAKHLERLGWIFIDDFQGGSVDKSPRFRASRHYADLLSHLRDGRRCIVSDIRVIHDEYRRDADTAIRQDLGSVPTELHLFQNDPKQCAQNVRNARDGRQVEPRLVAIEFWTHHYSAPPSAVLHEVWRPRGRRCTIG